MDKKFKLYKIMTQ